MWPCAELITICPPSRTSTTATLTERWYKKWKYYNQCRINIFISKTFNNLQQVSMKQQRLRKSFPGCIYFLPFEQQLVEASEQTNKASWEAHAHLLFPLIFASRIRDYRTDWTHSPQIIAVKKGFKVQFHKERPQIYRCVCPPTVTYNARHVFLISSFDLLIHHCC